MTTAATVSMEMLCTMTDSESRAAMLLQPQRPPTSWSRFTPSVKPLHLAHKPYLGTNQFQVEFPALRLAIAASSLCLRMIPSLRFRQLRPCLTTECHRRPPCERRLPDSYSSSADDAKSCAVQSRMLDPANVLAGGLAIRPKWPC